MMLNDILITPLDIIDTPGGSVFHAMKNIDLGFVGFGEAYFSEIEQNSIKAWKRHREMTLNLIVPIGTIKFVLFDNRETEKGQFQEVLLSRKTYWRLTVPPMIWMGFQGLTRGNSIVLNIANLPHNPGEIDRKNINEIEFDWSI